MPRIIFLNRFFYPDHSATSQILSDLAFHLAAAGRDVHVVASRQRYDDPGAELPERENVRGVQVRRVSTTNFGRSSLLGRSLDYLSCYRAMAHAMAELAQPGDVIVAKTDPPLLSVLAARAAARRGARLINWLQDLYPEVAVELGIPFVRGPVAYGLARLRDSSLNAAAVNVVLGDSMAGRVRAAGIPPEKIAIIPNWVDDEAIVPVPPADNPLRREWGLDGKFVIGYSGNLGRAHDYEPILAAAGRLRDRFGIVFLFIGGGRHFDELARRARENGLEATVRFLPYQDQSQLKYSLSAPDVHWLSLRPELEGLIFPSKFYGIAAAGRPIVVLAAPDGEISKLVERHGCGFAIGPTEVERLTGVILALAGDPQRCAAMGAAARAMLDADLTRRRAFERWGRVLDRLT